MVVWGPYHYAKIRSSFSTYRRLPRGLTISGQLVIGVGTIQLLFKPKPDDLAGVLIELVEVRHLPNVVCNGCSIEHAANRGLHYTTKDGGYGHMDEERGWYTEKFCGLRRIVRAGNPQGQLSFFAYSVFVYVTADLSAKQEKVGLHQS